MIDEFKERVREKEIAFTEEVWNNSLYLIERDLKLRLADNRWGTKGRYEMLIPNDKHIQTALAILKNVNIPSEVFASLR